MFMHLVELYVIVCSGIWFFTMLWIFPRPETVFESIARPLITFVISFIPGINFFVISAIISDIVSKKKKQIYK